MNCLSDSFQIVSVCCSVRILLNVMSMKTCGNSGNISPPFTKWLDLKFALRTHTLAFYYMLPIMNSLANSCTHWCLWVFCVHDVMFVLTQSEKTKTPGMGIHQFPKTAKTSAGVIFQHRSSRRQRYPTWICPQNRTGEFSGPHIRKPAERCREQEVFFYVGCVEVKICWKKCAFWFFGMQIQAPLKRWNICGGQATRGEKAGLPDYGQR